MTCPTTQTGLGALDFGITSARFQDPQFLDRDLKITKVKDFTSKTKTPKQLR